MSNPIRPRGRALPVRLSPRPVRAARRRLLHSPSLRASVHAAFWPAVVGCGVILALLLVVVTRDVYVGWDGVHPIPTGGAR